MPSKVTDACAGQRPASLAQNLIAAVSPGTEATYGLSVNDFVHKTKSK